MLKNAIIELKSQNETLMIQIRQRSTPMCGMPNLVLFCFTYWLLKMSRILNKNGIKEVNCSGSFFNTLQNIQGIPGQCEYLGKDESYYFKNCTNRGLCDQAQFLDIKVFFFQNFGKNHTKLESLWYFILFWTFTIPRIVLRQFVLSGDPV